jgi:glutathionyl-hydroquinone reductase
MIQRTCNRFRKLCCAGTLVHLLLCLVATTRASFQQSLILRTPRLHTVRSRLYANNVDKGFNLLELASGIVPQGKIVEAASESWKFVWKRMMAELAPQDKKGTYQRPAYTFAGKIGDATFPDEAGRYHLYTGNPCPWCHRVVLAVKVLGLTTDSQIGLTVLEDNPRKASRGGWVFSKQQPDRIFGGCNDLREIYDTLSPGFKGRCTAPLLVDKKSRRIVSNESSDIIRILNQASFGDVDAKEARIDLVPSNQLAQIDETNEWVYRLLNNGVYRCGFSTTQAAYDAASSDVRQGLQRCEEILQSSNYLCGPRFTEADLLLLPTILRFDGVYAPLFKAGGTHLRVKDYPALYQWLKRCWEMPAVRASIDISDACASYYRQLFPLNPGGIVPSSVTAKGLGLE